MKCPVCNRSWATALSVCPSCGSDIYSDESQVSIIGVTPRLEARPSPKLTIPAPPATVPAPQPIGDAASLAPKPQPGPQPISPSVGPSSVLSPPQKKVETASLAAAKTSPTLIGFQSRNQAIPDWRIELQNAVKLRKGEQRSSAESVEESVQYPTNGATALKPAPVREVGRPAVEISDPIVAKAMRRIEESRKAFAEPVAARSKPVTARPFGVVNPTARPAAPAPARITPPKPRLVSPAPVAAPVTAKRDTNKLPPLDSITRAPAAEPPVTIEAKEHTVPEFAEIKRIRIPAERLEPAGGEAAQTTDEIEDLAPLSMRFGAGLFDLIIGVFAGMLLLSPVAFTRSDWFSLTGLAAFAGAASIFLFLYMTICLGFFGKTMGMRLFSLELVDALENEYPTLRQAAANSAVFLLTLPFAGAGFLTLFYNEERRAVHDLLSGTILVREF